MNTLTYICFTFAFITTSSAYQCRKLCIFENGTCVTIAGFNLYKNVVHGVKGFLEPLDPLHIDKIEGVMESVQYNLTNITVVGLKDCKITKIRMNSTISLYRQYLNCPKLTSSFQFDAQENSDSPVLQGKGEAMVVAYDYDIRNYCHYSVFVNDDHQPHFFIKSYKSLNKLKGKLQIAITKAYVTDTSRVRASEDYMNKNCSVLEDFLHAPIVRRAMVIVIRNTDIFLRRYTFSDVLPEHNRIMEPEESGVSGTGSEQAHNSNQNNQHSSGFSFHLPTVHLGGFGFGRR